MASSLAIIQSIDQAAEHPGDLLELLLQRSMMLVRNELASACKLKLWNAFLHGTTCDPKKMFAVWLSETAIALSNVGRDGERRAVDLICKMVVTGGKLLGQVTYLVCKVDGLLVDQQLFAVGLPGVESVFAVIQAIDQAAEHAGNLLELLLELRVMFIRD